MSKNSAKVYITISLFHHKSQMIHWWSVLISLHTGFYPIGLQLSATIASTITARTPLSRSPFSPLLYRLKGQGSTFKLCFHSYLWIITGPLWGIKMSLASQIYNNWLPVPGDDSHFTTCSLSFKDRNAQHFLEIQVYTTKMESV